MATFAPTKPLAPVTNTVPELGVTVRGAAIAAAVERSRAAERPATGLAVDAIEAATAIAQRICVLLRALSGAVLPMTDAGASSKKAAEFAIKLASCKALGNRQSKLCGLVEVLVAAPVCRIAEIELCSHIEPCVEDRNELRPVTAERERFVSQQQ